MENNAVFNASVCLIGTVILLVHIANILIKRQWRKDEKALMSFLVFTALHFLAYFAFSMIPAASRSNSLIVGFYTGFYIANNVEVFLLFLYMLSYVEFAPKAERTLRIVNIALLAVFLALDVLNAFVPMFFKAEGGAYVRIVPAMYASQGYQFVMLAVVFFATAFHKTLRTREKVAFAAYCFLPLVAIVLQNFFKGYAIAYLSIIVATEVLFFFLNVERNIQLAHEKEKAKDAQIKVMLSQIQPHFIYNSLSSISTLIPIDPERAQQAIDDFTEYLRANLSSLTEDRLVPFENELKHIKTFLALEIVRFGSRVNVEYDVQASDFLVPTLSVEPLVENAVKHGILKKVEGGTVKISTYEREDAYVVVVADDGVGFDMEKVDFESNVHVGLNNIRYRLSSMVKSELDVQSKMGQGTTVTVAFFKNQSV